MPRKRPAKRRKLSKQKLCACTIKKQKYLSTKENLEGTVSFDQDTKTNIVVKSEDLNKVENIKFESSYDSLSAMVEDKLEFLCDEKEKSKILAKCQVPEQVNQNSGILSLTPFSDTIKNSISENMNKKNYLEIENKHKNMEVEFEKNIKQENIFFEKIPLVELRQLSEADLRKWTGTEKSVTNVTKNNMAPKKFEPKQVIHTEQVKLSNVFKEGNNTCASNIHSVGKLLKRDYNYRIPQAKTFRKKCFKLKCDLVTFRAKSSDPIFKSYTLVSGVQIELRDKEKTNEPSKILRLVGHPKKPLSKELLKRLGSRGSVCERAIDSVQQINQETVGKDNIKSVEVPFSEINKELQPYKQPISIYRAKHTKLISKECTVLDRGKRQECYHPQENNQETDTPENTNQQNLTQLSNSKAKPSEATASHVFISPTTIKRPPSRPKHNMKKSIDAFPLSCASSVNEMANNDKRDTVESWRENDCLSLYAESLSESLVNNVSTKNYEGTSMCDFTSEESMEYGRIDINSWIENNPVGRSLSPEQSNINENNSNPVQCDSNNYDKNESFNLRDRNEHTDSRAAYIQKNEPIKMNNKNENRANTSSFNKQWKSSCADLTFNLFYNVCPQLKMQNKCSLPNCRYTHNWPCDWKNKMLGMQKDDVMYIYNSAKAKSEIHLLKMILTVVLKQLATAKDLNNIFLLIQDIITTDLNSDRQPYIKIVIEYLCECGFEYYMVVDLIFTCTSLEKNLKELLADILLTLTVENEQLYDNWNTVRKLCKYKEYDLDNGVVQSILRQTFETPDLDERLCRAVYNDLIKPLADVKPIPTKILLLCVQGLEKIGLKSESQSLNAKIDHFKSQRSTPENDFVANNCSQLESVYRNSSTYFHSSLNESRQSGSPSPPDSRVSAAPAQQISCGSQVSARTIASKANLHAPGVSQVPSKIPRLSASETRVSIADSHEPADAPKLFTAESIFVSPVQRIPATKSRVSTTGSQAHGSQASTSGPPMSTGEPLFPPPFWQESDAKAQVPTTEQQKHTHGLQASVSGSQMSTAEHLFPRPVRRTPDSKSAVPTADPQQAVHSPRVSVSGPRMSTAEHLFSPPVRPILDSKSTASTASPQKPANGPRVPVSGPRRRTKDPVFPPPFRKLSDSKSVVPTTDPHKPAHGPRVPVSGPRMSAAKYLFPPPVRRIPESTVSNTDSQEPDRGPPELVSGSRMSAAKHLFPPPVRRIPESTVSNTDSQEPDRDPPELVSGPRMSAAKHLFPPPVRRIPESTVSNTDSQEPDRGPPEFVSGPRMSAAKYLFPPPVRRIPESTVSNTDSQEPDRGPPELVSRPRMSAAKHLFPPPVRRIPESTVSNTDSQEPDRGPPELVSGPRMSAAKHLFPPPVRRIPESTVSNTDSQGPDRGPPEFVSGPGVSMTKYLFPPPVRRICASKSAVPSTGPQQAVHGLREPVSGSRISSSENQFPPPVHRLPDSETAMRTPGPQERGYSRREPGSDSRKSTAEHLFPPSVRRIPESTVSNTDSQKPARDQREPVAGPRMATAERLFPPLVRRIPESTVSSANPPESAHGAREPVSGPSLPTPNPLFPPPSLRAPVSGPSESPTAPHEFGVDEMGSSSRTSTPNSSLSEQLDEPVIDNEIDISDEQMKHEDNTILKTDIQRAVFTSELSTILSYVERYHIPDRLVLSCLEALREILFAVPQFYQNLYKKASDIKEKNERVQIFLKTLGINLVLLLWRSNDWNSAFEVLKDFNTQFQYYCKDVKSLLPESSSIFKTSIVFCDIYLKKMYIQNAWNVLKENILDSNTFDDCNPADLKYAETVLKLFMEKLCTPTWSYYGIQVVSHFIEQDFKLIDVGQYIDKIFTLSVNENCPMDNIRKFMRITNWYNNISELTFRALVVHALKNSEKLLYFKLLETGMDLSIYPKIFGNEDVFEISVQYAYEEVIVLLEYLFVNMVRYMPRQNILLIKIRDRMDRVYDFDEPTANCLSIQQDFPPKQMLARVVNILQNTFQMDITYHEQSNSVCIEKEQLMLHLLRLRS